METRAPALIQFADVSKELIMDGTIKPYTPVEYQLAGVVLAYAQGFAARQQGFKIYNVRVMPILGGHYLDYNVRFDVDPYAGPSTKYTVGLKYERNTTEQPEAFAYLVHSLANMFSRLDPTQAQVYTPSDQG